MVTLSMKDIIILSVAFLIVVLSVVMLSVSFLIVVLSVFMLNVVAPI
jgi:hypothetical protein